MSTEKLFYKKAVNKKVLLDWQNPQKNQECFSTCSKNLRNLRKFVENFAQKIAANSQKVKESKFKIVLRKS